MVIGAALAAASAVTALFWIGGTPRVRPTRRLMPEMEEFVLNGFCDR